MVGTIEGNVDLGHVQLLIFREAPTPLSNSKHVRKIVLLFSIQLRVDVKINFTVQKIVLLFSIQLRLGVKINYTAWKIVILFSTELKDGRGSTLQCTKKLILIFY